MQEKQRRNRSQQRGGCKRAPKEIVTAQIAGIEVMDLEDAKSIMEDQYLRRERKWVVQDRLFVYQMQP